MTEQLVTFLRARLDEDAKAANDFEGACWHADYCDASPDFHTRFAPPRILAEVEAKREIVRLHWQRVSRWCEVCDIPGDSQGRPEGCTTVRLLALPYADHPDYRPEWRP